MSYQFDPGTTDHLAGAAQLTQTSLNRTLYVKFRVDSANATRRFLVASTDTTGTFLGAFLELHSSGTNVVRFGFSTGGSTSFPAVTWTSGFAAGSDHILIITYDGANIIIYADSDTTAKASLGETGTPDNSGGTPALYIGNFTASSTLSWDGLIYEVAYWDGTVLGSSDRTVLGGGGAPTDCSVQPTHYWPFTADATDAAGNLDLTVNGATLVDEAAPQFVGLGTAASSATTTALSPGLPTGWAEDDLFILYGTMNNNTAPTTPSGWTILSDGVTSVAGNNGTGQRYAAFYRFATASESAPSVAHTGNVSKIWRIAAFRGVDPTTPFHKLSVSANASSTTIATSGVTSTIGHTLGVMLGLYNDNPTAATTPTDWTQPTGSLVNTSSGSDSALVLFYRQFSTAGSYGSPSSVTSGAAANVNVGVLIGLAPLATGDVTVNAVTPTVTSTAAAASILTGSSLTGVAGTATSAAQVATPGIGISVTAVSGAVTSAAAAASVVTGASVPGEDAAASAAALAATPAGGLTIPGEDGTATAAAPTAAVVLGASVTAEDGSASAVAPVASVVTGAIVGAGVASASAASAAAAVSAGAGGDATVSANLATVTSTAGASAVSGGATVLAALPSGAYDEGTYDEGTYDGESAFARAYAAASVGEAAGTGASVNAVSATVTSAALASSVLTGASVSAVVGTVTAQSAAATVSAGGGTSVGAATASVTASALAAALATGATLSVVTGAVTSRAWAASVSTTATASVSASVATVTAQANAADPRGGLSIAATRPTVTSRAWAGAVVLLLQVAAARATVTSRAYAVTIAGDTVMVTNYSPYVPTGFVIPEAIAPVGGVVAERVAPSGVVVAEPVAPRGWSG